MELLDILNKAKDLVGLEFKDGKYAWETFSPEAQRALMHIKTLDEKINKLQFDLEELQVSYESYFLILKENVSSELFVNGQ